MPGKSNTENYRLQAGILWPVFKPRTKFLGPALFYPLKQPLKLGSSTGESGGLPSMGSHRVGHDWSDLAAAAAACFTLGFLGGASGKEHACQCRRHEMWVRSLGQEDPLEEGMATHSSILFFFFPLQYSCLENPRDREEPGGLQSMVTQSQTWLGMHAHALLYEMTF